MLFGLQNDPPGGGKGSPRVDSSAGGSRERAGEKVWEQRN